MASSSSQPLRPDVIEIKSVSSDVPICLPLGPDGVVEITPSWLGIRFGYDASTLWLETDVLDPDTLLVQYSMVVEPVVLENNATMWKLKPGKYRLYGLTESVMNASTVLLTPPSSSTLSTVDCEPKNPHGGGIWSQGDLKEQDQMKRRRSHKRR